MLNQPVSLGLAQQLPDGTQLVHGDTHNRKRLAVPSGLAQRKRQHRIQECRVLELDRRALGLDVCTFAGWRLLRFAVHVHEIIAGPFREEPEAFHRARRNGSNGCQTPHIFDPVGTWSARPRAYAQPSADRYTTAQRNLQDLLAGLAQIAWLRHGVRIAGLIMTVRRILRDNFDPARRCQLPDYPQQLCFHNGRVVRMVDRGREPVHEFLELRVPKPFPAKAAPQPFSNAAVQAHQQTRVSRSRPARGGPRRKHSLTGSRPPFEVFRHQG